MMKLIVITILVLILILIILNYKKKENFTENNIILVSLDIFNEIFDSKLVILPEDIKAIGFLNNNMYVYSINTKQNEYLNDFRDYWMPNIHPKINKNKYYVVFNVSDGIRESVKYFEGNLELYKPEFEEFKDKWNIQVKNNNLYPILHKNVAILCNGKHNNDVFSVCIPDRFYMKSHGYKSNLKLIDENNIDFDSKINECIYKGNVTHGWVTNFIKPEGKLDLIPRKYLLKLKDEGYIKKLNFTTEFKSIPEQIKYKYILDIDGFASTWDAAVWKLYSGSVLLKTKSVWKQWYYDDLHEWVHYVPVENDFSDLDEKIEWCMNNNDKCKEIVANAKKFVLEKLNWEQSIKDTIEAVKDII